MTDARITLDAAALDAQRGRTLLPGPVTADRIISQARAALDLQARIATLEAELAESRADVEAERKRANDWMARVDSADHEGCAWMEHANALRDALEHYTKVDACEVEEKCGHPKCEFPECVASFRRAKVAVAVLAQTPAASLAAHDAEVLEPYKAALRVFVDAGALDDFADDFAAEVRALSAQAATHSTLEVKP